MVGLAQRVPPTSPPCVQPQKPRRGVQRIEEKRLKKAGRLFQPKKHDEDDDLRMEEIEADGRSTFNQRETQMDQRQWKMMTLMVN